MLIEKEDAIQAICEACYMYKYIGEHYKDCKYYPCDDVTALEAIPSAEQVTGKLKKPCDSLLTEDSEERKEHKSKLESAEAVQGWIPCSERLPNTNEVVIMSYKTTDKVHVGKYLDDGSENPWWSYIDDCCAWNNVVTAWMPLPCPYREDGEA